MTFIDIYYGIRIPLAERRDGLRPTLASKLVRLDRATTGDPRGTLRIEWRAFLEAHTHTTLELGTDS